MTTPVFGLCGWSGSGKTTLLVKLIAVLSNRGLTVSTIKHAHHSFDIDRPGKDSHHHRMAGAHQVMVASGQRWALMHELRGADEPAMADLIARLDPTDLVLVEGFKYAAHAKLEVHRPALGKPLLQPQDRQIRAVASDQSLAGLSVPCLDLNDVAAIAAFIVDDQGLDKVATG